MGPLCTYVLKLAGEEDRKKGMKDLGVSVLEPQTGKYVGGIGRDSGCVPCSSSCLVPALLLVTMRVRVPVNKAGDYAGESAGQTRLVVMLVTMLCRIMRSWSR
jgi:hypothetical protein